MGSKEYKIMWKIVAALDTISSDENVRAHAIEYNGFKTSVKNVLKPNEYNYCA